MDQILTITDLCGAPGREGRAPVPGLLGLSRTTVWRKVRDGDFPAPIKLTERRRGWFESDIRRWLDERGRATESETREGGVERDRTGAASAA